MARSTVNDVSGLEDRFIDGNKLNCRCERQGNPMNDPLTPDERRRQHFEDYKDRVDRHRQGSAFYEQRAIEFVFSAMKGMTYLNGGGLVAIPTVVALFRADPGHVKSQLLYAAAAFIAGLVSVAFSQAFAFFVMARRAEAEVYYQFEQMELLGAVHYPNTPDDQKGRNERAQENRNTAIAKTRTSDKWRALALIFIWLSLLLFIAGCYLGGNAVLEAK
jgi:hypothetical protein